MVNNEHVDTHSNLVTNDISALDFFFFVNVRGLLPKMDVL
jgi:hypothetical protein